MRTSFEAELQREVSREGHELDAESARRQLSMQQHGSNAAIGVIAGSDSADRPGSASAAGRAPTGSSSSNSDGGTAGIGGGSSYGCASSGLQQRQMPGTSVKWAPGVGVVPADREDAAAAATLGVPVRSRSSSTLSSAGASGGNIAALNPASVEARVAAKPQESRSTAGRAVEAEESSTAAVVTGTPRAAQQQQQQQQGSPQGGLVQGLWDTALMSYLQRDTALLEGITGKGHHVHITMAGHVLCDVATCWQQRHSASWIIGRSRWRSHGVLSVQAACVCNAAEHQN
jgi:hypothetical protein